MRKTTSVPLPSSAVWYVTDWDIVAHQPKSTIFVPVRAGGVHPITTPSLYVPSITEDEPESMGWEQKDLFDTTDSPNKTCSKRSESY